MRFILRYLFHLLSIFLLIIISISSVSCVSFKDSAGPVEKSQKIRLNCDEAYNKIINILPRLDWKVVSSSSEYERIVISKDYHKMKDAIIGGALGYFGTHHSSSAALDVEKIDSDNSLIKIIIPKNNPTLNKMVNDLIEKLMKELSV